MSSREEPSGKERISFPTNNKQDELNITTEPTSYDTNNIIQSKKSYQPSPAQQKPKQIDSWGVPAGLGELAPEPPGPAGDSRCWWWCGCG